LWNSHVTILISDKVVDDFVIESEAWDDPISPEQMMKMTGAN